MEAIRKQEEDHGVVRARRWTSLDRRSAIALGFVHGLCVLAPFQFTWDAFWVAVALYVVTGLFGITLSYHRNLAHRSFKIRPKWLEYLFAYLGVHALQGEPIDWVSTHRHHHQFVDSERDPHSPIEGIWFSHIGWIFDSYSLTQRISSKSYQKLENRKMKFFRNMFVGYLKYGTPTNVNDLLNQPFYMFLRKTYLLHPIALGVVLYIAGGLPFLVWGLGVRTVACLHVTFMVNSVCHTWGKQKWNTGDLSKNNWLIGLLMFGEGWHNNHHAFERSARQGLEWWQIDMTWWVVIFLQALGIASDVKYPSEIQMQKLALN